MAKILKPNDYNLNLCKKALEESKVIAVPTETVYGLAGNALNEDALSKIFKIKGRPLFNPLIIHVDNLKTANKYADFNDLAKKLAKRFWPGPLTMILQKRAIVPNLVTAGLNTVAIRCPKNSTFHNLLSKLDFPLAAPSANPFGYISPTKAEHVNDSLGEKLEYILDGYECNIGIESTIIDVRNESNPKILRPGPITKEELEDITKNKFSNPSISPKNQKKRAPGMLKSHYSPQTALKVISHKKLYDLAMSNNSPHFAYIFNQKPVNIIDKLINIYWLSENGNTKEIARNFYDLLRRLDKLKFRKIYIESVKPSGGMNSALIDRLSKAAYSN